jgi:class 3 adenylate cyclase
MGRRLTALLCVLVALSYAIARWFIKGPWPDLILFVMGVPLLLLLATQAVSFPLRLRLKFVATIVFITLSTAAIIFWSLSVLETREQVTRIEQQSAIFTRFSTDRVVSIFLGDFEKHYLDRFLPGVRELIASDQDLVSFRIISARSRNVLFDSETALAASSAATPEVVSVQFPREIEEQLLSRDLVSRKAEKGGEPYFDVVNTYRAENGSAVFLIDYAFSYQSLKRSLRLIRSQILLDLVPAVAIGFLIALGFAQILLAPIRTLMSALKQVTSGNYSVQVPIQSRDEIGELTTTFNHMTEELRRKQELRKFLSNSSYQRIMRATERGDGQRMGGRRVQATILFSDIRGFVAHCEALDAEDVTSMLNDYFSEMVEVIHRNGGEVDKFIGDAILAVFYEETDSQASQSSSLKAVYCALGMKARLAEFNARRASQGKATLEIGVGISRGEIISGPIGSDDRMDFTVIGDVVNLANRIEKLSKLGRHTRVVFSDSVEQVVRGLLDYEELEIEGGIRGKSEEVRVFELIRIKELAVLRANLSLLGDANAPLRVRSVELLGQSGHREAVAILSEALGDPNDSVRVASASALARSVESLGASENTEALNALFKSLSNERSLKTISALITSIGKLCRTERILELAPFLKHYDERIIANTVEAMGWARLPRAVDLILPMLTHSNNRIKANAAMGLFAGGHVEVVDTLKPMLMHSEALMRSSAAFALGEITLIADLDGVVAQLKSDAKSMRFYLAELQDCVPMLVSLLRDPDLTVRRQAVIALGKIKDKSAVLPMIELLDGLPADSSSEMARDILGAFRSIGSHRIIRDVLARYAGSS